MPSRRFVHALFASTLMMSLGISTANTEDAPQGNKGFTASKITVVELGPEIEGMEGRQLRLRLLTITPGGYIGLHSHKDRPAVVYLIQGTDVVGLADGSTKTLHPGDTSSATKNTMHYHRNAGSDDVLLIAVDVIKSSK